jgi:hypothetical protein
VKKPGAKAGLDHCPEEMNPRRRDGARFLIRLPVKDRRRLPPRVRADMKLIMEFLERAEQFERFADRESDSTLKEQFLRQAEAYRELARKRAAQLGRQPPTGSN